MAHTLIIGQTMSGKSTLAKILCRGLVRAGIPCLVLDPLLDRDWKTYGAAWVTDNPDLFYEYARKNRSCALFLDESADTIGRNPGRLQWFATQARHWGHSSIFMAQRLTQLTPTVRDQCATLYVFACSRRDLETIAEERDRSEILQRQLQRGECWRIRNFEPTSRLALDFPKRTIRKIA